MDKKQKYLDIDYSHTYSFTKLVNRIESQNLKYVDAEYSKEIKFLQEGLDGIYSIVSKYAWCFKNPHIAYLNKANTVLFSAVHKNLIALYASLQFTRQGFYGPARAVLRHVFESLLIAKFCSISQDSSIYKKWKEGDVIYLKNGVLKKIRSPDTEAFSEFWGLMSEYSHATIYAQQVSMNVQSDPDQVPLNFVYMCTLLDCLYHLMNRHLITSSMVYYTNRYRKNDGLISDEKERMKEVLKLSRSTLLKRPKEIIKNYCAEWRLD